MKILQKLLSQSKPIFVCLAVVMLTCRPSPAQWRSVAGFGDQSVVALHDAGATGLFVSLRTKTVMRSTDGGDNWQRRDFGLGESEQIFSFTEHDDALIAVTYRGAVFRSTDAGAVWEPLSRQPDQPTVNVIYSQGGYLWLATSDRFMLRSVDGLQWSAAHDGLRDGEVVTTLAAHENELYAGTPTGVARWNENAGRWEYISDGLTGRRIYSLQSTEDRLYAGSDSDGIYVRTSDLSFWQKLSTGFSGGSAVADMTHYDGSVAATTLGGEVVVWEPWLQSWHNIGTGLPASLQPAVLMTVGTTLFVGGLGDGLYSRDLQNVVLDVSESTDSAATDLRIRSAEGRLTVVNDGDSGQNLKLEVFSLRGVRVAGDHVRLNAGESKVLDLPGRLPAGVYAVRLSSAAVKLSVGIAITP